MEGSPKPSTVEWLVVILQFTCIAHLAEPHTSPHQVAKEKGLHRQEILNLAEAMTRIVAMATAATQRYHPLQVQQPDFSTTRQQHQGHGNSQGISQRSIDPKHGQHGLPEANAQQKRTQAFKIQDPVWPKFLCVPGYARFQQEAFRSDRLGQTF